MTYPSTAYDDWGDELFSITGKIIIAYGQLEHVLKLALKRVTAISYADAMDIADKFRSNPSLADRVRKEFEKWAMNQHLEAQMHNVVEKIFEVNRFRNIIVHGYWHQKIEDQSLRIVKGASRIEITPGAKNDFQKLHQGIIAIRDALNALTSKKFKRNQSQNLSLTPTLSCRAVSRSRRRPLG